MRAIIVLALVARTAAADPQPQPQPRPAYTWRTVEASLRFGWATDDDETFDYRTSTGQIVTGSAPFVELEGELRRRRFGFAVAASVLTYRDRDASVGMSALADVRAVTGVIAARARVHFGPVFLGPGLGVYRQSWSGTSYSQHVSGGDTRAAPELHLGMGLPKLGPVRPEVFGVGAFFVGGGGGTGRIAIGVQF